MALTANKTAEDRDQAYEMGCAGYISKPIIDVDIIQDAVIRILGEK
jgi:CheY-like chemotaxis protein